MRHPRIRFSVGLLAALCLFCLITPAAEARWYWTKRQAFGANLVCQDGAIVSVGAEAQNDAQIILYFDAIESGLSLGQITITMPPRPVARYAAPDAAYTPFDPNGMYMQYYETLRLTWDTQLPIGSTIYVSAYNHQGELVQVPYPVLNCQIKPTLYTRATVTWRKPSTGEIVRTFHDGATTVGVGRVGSIRPGWEIVGGGDYNGDLQRDIFLHHAPDDSAQLYLLNGASIATFGLWEFIDPAIRIVGNKDYNGDGLDDMLARNERTGKLYVTFLTNDNTANNPITFDNQPDLNWFVAGSGDFDANGSADVLWRNRATGALRILFYCPRSGAKYLIPIANSSPLNQQVVGVADFDGNLLADILFYDTQTGGLPMILSPSDWRGAVCGPDAHPLQQQDMQKAVMARSVSAAGSSSFRAISTDDFNGDGNADLLWYDRQTNLYTLWLLDGRTVRQESVIGAPERSGWVAVDTTDTAADRDIARTLLPLIIR